MGATARDPKPGAGQQRDAVAGFVVEVTFPIMGPWVVPVRFAMWLDSSGQYDVFDEWASDHTWTDSHGDLLTTFGRKYGAPDSVISATEAYARDVEQSARGPKRRSPLRRRRSL